ncbi:MAG: AAA family ATPase [bacterium]|nr:AAA family ATPase [bacterium]
MKTYKIVLTGGPCGGKTNSIEFLSKKLSDLDYSVKIVDETANYLLKLGYMPSVNISTFDFQNLLFKIQFLNEYMSEGKSNILLCDRGLFDGKVYIDNNDFQRILDSNKVEEKKVFSTYDGALYFRSISHEYPDEFSKKRIYESPEVGRIRDERCKEIWAGKIVFCNYDNLDGFKNKQEMIYLALKKQLEYLNQIKSYNLSDYYDIEYFKYIYCGINDILVKNDISDDIKIKTKGLIR